MTGPPRLLSTPGLDLTTMLRPDDADPMVGVDDRPTRLVIGSGPVERSKVRLARRLSSHRLGVAGGERRSHEDAGLASR